MRTNRCKGARACARHTFRDLIVLCCFCIAPCLCSAQSAFNSVIRRALEKSSRVRAAELDLKKAQQNLAIAKDIFVPSVVTGGGLGWTYGITLSVPTIFTVNAQSLVYSNQQRFAIRAAHADVQAAQFALAEARQQTEEDVAIALIELDQNQAALAALSEQQDFSAKLVSILEDRVRAGLDSELDLHKAQRGALQMDLQRLQAEDDRASLQSHLSELTGLPESEVQVAHDSIPEIPDLRTADPNPQSSLATPGLRAAEATARAKMERAKGEANYTWRPIINFAAQYGRVSPINDVSSFYNLHENYNTANLGVIFSFPMFDRIRKDAARASAADAARSEIDIQNQRFEENANRMKMTRSVRLIETRAKMAELDLAIAQDELKSVGIQLHGTGGSPPITPKEEQQAKIQERQKYIDLLNARLELAKARISLMRQTGQLDDWVGAATVASGHH
ncbi:TolC family protein [Occallatibacter savannae]|uniref:TolC family protein n=1 Tax=Occallatibacter savannae TaxID=1002691 RepID=UPI000D69F85E|nr:TolC family protein [Occallatibacter savannae]